MADLAASRADPMASRLLYGLAASGAAVGLDEHVRGHGSLPWRGRGRGGGPGPLVATVAQAGLRGRGGAAFPTAVKLRAIGEAGGRGVVVANGAEGEPASAKDTLLLTALPHLVLDGLSLAAEAVDARHAILYARASALPSVADALRERRAAGYDRTKVRLVAAPERYLAGEESALVRRVNRGPAKPTFVPPRPYERGVAGRPTGVQNVETLAHLALIARHGADWFRELGTPAEPGTMLLSVSGAVGHPGVYEAQLGTSLGTVLAEAGAHPDRVQAVLVGGYSGVWLATRLAWPVPLCNQRLHDLGAPLGPGVVVALPDDACGLVETARVVRYMAAENADQCGPCINGLGAIADGFAQLARGRHEPGLPDRLRDWAALVRGRGACHHPDGAARFVDSALSVFAPEVAEHARRRACPRAHRAPVLPIPAPTVAAASWR